MKTQLLILISFVYLTAQAQIQLHPEKAVSRNEGLSFIADNVRFISFDSNAGISFFTDHFVSQDHIILFGNKDVLVYDSNGNPKFVMKNDPAFRQRSMAVNDADKEIYVLSKTAPVSYRMATYSFEGKLLKTGTLTLPDTPRKFMYQGKKIFFIGDDALSSEDYMKYQWIEADAHTLDISYIKHDTDSLGGNDFQGIVSFGRKASNQLLYWNLYNDTIYNIKENGYDTPYIWVKGDYRFTRKEALHTALTPKEETESGSLFRDNLMRITNVLDTDRYLLVEVREDNEEKQLVYDKVNQEFTKTSLLTDDITGSNCTYRFDNYFKIDGKEYITATVTDFDVKNQLHKQGKEAVGRQVLVLIAIKKPSGNR